MISGALLQLDGVLGLHGWQWLFLLEAAPSILLACAVLALMTDRPEQAALARGRGAALAEGRTRGGACGHAQGSRASHPQTGPHRPAGARLGAIYFTIGTATYGITFFMPPILKSLHLTDWETGVATAVPYVVGTWAWSPGAGRRTGATSGAGTS